MGLFKKKKRNLKWGSRIAFADKNDVFIKYFNHDFSTGMFKISYDTYGSSREVQISTEEILNRGIINFDELEKILLK